jgi:site-specific recombinase XerD
LEKGEKLVPKTLQTLANTGLFRFVPIILYGHSYAVNSIRSGDDIKTIQENLGHHTAAFTLDMYGHVTESMRRESADRMEAFIKGIPDA